MYVHCYIPDALGKEAKRAKLNLSGLLRRAVEAELRRSQPVPEVEVRRAGKNIEIVVRVPGEAL